MISFSNNPSQIRNSQGPGPWPLTLSKKELITRFRSIAEKIKPEASCPERRPSKCEKLNSSLPQKTQKTSKKTLEKQKKENVPLAFFRLLCEAAKEEEKIIGIPFKELHLLEMAVKKQPLAEMKKGYAIPVAKSH